MQSGTPLALGGWNNMDQVAQSEAILVVEDEALIRMVAVDALSDCGLRLYDAGDADEALEMIEEHPEIRLVFTDVNMPGTMDGLRLVERVHSLWPKIELIVTSGRERLLDRQLPEHGSFLSKPYLPSQLVDMVLKKIRRVPLQSYNR
jgi:CheY-like chemotaxis protein